MTNEALKSIRVLVVDDDGISQKIAVAILNNIGINNIDLANNGTEALDILATADHSFDLVITDIEMPEMDGFELARKIRLGTVEKIKAIPILLLTGRNTDENIRKGRIHRIQGFIIKPPSAEVLEHHIIQALKIK